MMILAKLVKTPAERRRYEVDYSAWLADGETIVSVIFSVSQDNLDDTPVSPLVVDAYAIASPATNIVIFVSLGDVSESYAVDIKATTSIGQVKEDTIRFSVRAPNTATC